jgi:hypothetical protein
MRVVAQVAGSCTQACKDICQLPSGELIFAFTLSCHNVSTPGTPGKAGGVWELEDEACESARLCCAGVRTLPGLKHMEP